VGAAAVLRCGAVRHTLPNMDVTSATPFIARSFSRRFINAAPAVAFTIAKRTGSEATLGRAKRALGVDIRNRATFQLSSQNKW
jgi:hypothetical protein